VVLEIVRLQGCQDFQSLGKTILQSKAALIFSCKVVRSRLRFPEYKKIEQSCNVELIALQAGSAEGRQPLCRKDF
jgi:hypothetical protein